MLAGLATSLVVAAQSIVSFDVATSMIPGWHSTLFPAYFVIGAIYSGLAMLITLVVPLRVLCGFKGLITAAHLESMCKLIIATSLLVGYAYIVEFWTAWQGGSTFERFAFGNRVTGPYAWCFGLAILCGVLVPQLFWFRWFRTTPWAMFSIAVLVNIGAWFDRFVIIATSLTHDYLPSSWKAYDPTGAEFLQLLGGFGLFTCLLLLFVRFLPLIAVSEVKAQLPVAGAAGSGTGEWSNDRSLNLVAGTGPRR